MTIPFGRPDAVARVSGNHDAPCLYGSVKFYAMGRNVLVVANICGLPKSNTDFYAMHIHDGVDCQNSLGHYNPENTVHPRHVGDLPPLMSCGGYAFTSVLTDRFQISEVIGKTLIIHSQPDDFHSQPSGNAGVPIACGIISQR